MKSELFEEQYSGLCADATHVASAWVVAAAAVILLMTVVAPLVMV